MELSEALHKVFYITLASEIPCGAPSSFFNRFAVCTWLAPLSPSTLLKPKPHLGLPPLLSTMVRTIALLTTVLPVLNANRYTNATCGSQFDGINAKIATNPKHAGDDYACWNQCSAELECVALFQGGITRTRRVFCCATCARWKNSRRTSRARATCISPCSCRDARHPTGASAATRAT